MALSKKVLDLLEFLAAHPDWADKLLPPEYQGDPLTYAELAGLVSVTSLRLIGDLLNLTPAGLLALTEERLTRQEPSRHQDGPDRENGVFWLNQKSRPLEMEPATWKLFVAAWGKPFISVADAAEALGKSRRVGYEKIKVSVTKLNSVVVAADLPFSWTKKRGQNLIEFTESPASASVTK
jgi:hypothetical protein